MIILSLITLIAIIQAYRSYPKLQDSWTYTVTDVKTVWGSITVRGFE